MTQNKPAFGATECLRLFQSFDEKSIVDFFRGYVYGTQNIQSIKEDVPQEHWISAMQQRQQRTSMLYPEDQDAAYRKGYIYALQRCIDEEMEQLHDHV